MKTILTLLFASTVLHAAPPATYDEALALARECLSAEEAAKRATLLQQARNWSERLDDIALALRPVPPKDAKTGYIEHDRFTVPRLRTQLERLLPKVPGPIPEKFKSEVKDRQFRLMNASGVVLWTRPYPDPMGSIPQLIAKDPNIRDTAFRLRWKALGVDAGLAGGAIALTDLAITMASKNDAPAIDGMLLNATAAIVWADSEDFKLSQAQLSDSLQLSGTAASV